MMTHGTNNPWNSLIPDEWLEPADALPAMDQVVFGGYEGEPKNLGAAGRLQARVTRFESSASLGAPNKLVTNQSRRVRTAFCFR